MARFEATFKATIYVEAPDQHAAQEVAVAAAKAGVRNLELTGLTEVDAHGAPVKQEAAQVPADGGEEGVHEDRQDPTPVESHRH